MGGFTTLLLFGLMAIGYKNRIERKTFEQSLRTQTNSLDSNSKETLKVLQAQQEQQQKIIDRLQNLETIVTSEAWDAIKDGESKEVIDLLLNENESEDISSDEKAKKIAKKVR